MRLEIIIGDHSMQIEVPDETLEQNQEGFARLDASMARGIQLGPDWLETPTVEQRCRLAADKLLTAIDKHDEGQALLASGYILTRRPGTSGVRIDVQGEPAETEFF